ncbi:DUF6702 family protein [Paraflavisolibacter sp. H34]|uniref:DUF6702 family protein n=1 Tax=Huijunlia imazamoxiresistens TaxID=3127457 RepID=UPI00301B61A5
MASILYQWLLALSLSFGGPAAPARIVGTEVLHPFYVGVIEINHNSREKALEITCKLFAEDIEAILEKNSRAKVDLSTPGPQTDRLVHDYISHHLLLAVDGKRASLAFVGFEKQGESVYCYLQAPAAAPPKKLSLTNTLLHDFTNKQVNIMHVTVFGKRQSLKLDYPSREAAFEF